MLALTLLALQHAKTSAIRRHLSQVPKEPSRTLTKKVIQPAAVHLAGVRSSQRELLTLLLARIKAGAFVFPRHYVAVSSRTSSCTLPCC